MFANRIRARAPACFLALCLGAAALAGCASRAGTGPVAEGEFYEQTRTVEGPVIEDRYEPVIPAGEYDELVSYPYEVGGQDLYPSGPAFNKSLLDIQPPWLPPLGSASKPETGRSGLQ